MKGGVPFWAFIAIFFGPALIVILTMNLFLMLAAPVLWVLIRATYAGNPNRPWEWFLSVSSGTLFADWREWGGISDDPHSSPARQDGMSL
jgi:hypothetical protein